MIKVHTKDGRYFRLSSFDFVTRIGLVVKDGRTTSTIYFTDDSIIAVEKIKDGEYKLE